MAQLFFRCGAMSSSKSIEMLEVAHNYEAQGRKTVLMTGSVDDRSDVGTAASRIGLHREAEPISEDLNLFNYVSEMSRDDVESGNGTVAYVLIDETQFLKKHHVLECVRAVDELKILMMAFGLKNDFQDHLFEGSENLSIFADKIEEMKTTYHYYGHKTIMNLQINPGKLVYEGGQVQIGGDESCYPVCRFHCPYPDRQR